MKTKSFWPDILLVMFLLVVAGTYYWGAADLPKGTYDPLGSATIPRIMCIAIGLLSIVLLIKTLLERDQNIVEEKTTPNTPRKEKFSLALLIGLYFIVYVAAMNFRYAGFIVSTFIFLTASSVAIKLPKGVHILILLSFSAALSFGLHFTFTQIFVVDLPR